MKVIIAGGTGFIGRALAAALKARGDSVSVLGRSGGELRWDGKTLPSGALDGADAVVNLAGESIADGRWTAARKLQLIRSRVDSTRALAAAIAASPRPPKTFLSSSAVGYYGLRPAGDCPEAAPQGADFLAALCGQWEREALAASKACRVVLARTGVVLGREGGAYAKMRLPFKLGVGGRLGEGTQPFPWIHVDDEVGALLHLLDTPSLSGPVNLVAPGLVDNAAFTKSLGRALGRPTVLPAPAFALRLALGEMAEMLLGGCAARPAALEKSGYRFKHAAIDEALRSLA